jgi:FkbM family methyltransferase
MKSNVYVYGAGKLGSLISKSLIKNGKDVAGFIDKKKVGEIVNDLRVYDFSVLDSRSEVYIAVLNNWVYLKEVISEAMEYKVKKILTPPQVFFELGKLGEKLDWYWLSSEEGKVINIWEETRTFYSNKLDAESLEILDLIMRYRLGGEYEDSFVEPESMQYKLTGIKGFWDGDVSLVDCGSYTGDTLKSLLDSGISLKSAYAFEPDLNNFKDLADNFNKMGLKGICLPTAVGDKVQNVAFSAQGDTGSSISNDLTTEHTTALQVSADNVIFSEVTHVKMDIEGAELSALKGMTRILLEHHPKLAISAYHRPDDLIAIGKFLDSLGIYSNWSIRCFAQQSFETILYVS